MSEQHKVGTTTHRERIYPPRGITVKPGPTEVDREAGMSTFDVFVQDEIVVSLRCNHGKDGDRKYTVIKVQDGLYEHLPVGHQPVSANQRSARLTKVETVRALNVALQEGWRPDGYTEPEPPAAEGDEADE